jgi:hypothetical protein
LFSVVRWQAVLRLAAATSWPSAFTAGAVDFMAGASEEDSAARAAKRFTKRDILDLQCWSNLSWIHPLAFEQDKQLAEFRNFFLMASKESKPTVSDEDNDASMYVDDIGWTIHRKRAWMAVLCGAHYDFIDFSIQAHLEGGTTESQNKIRNWIKHLSEFISSFDFIHASPAQDWILSTPEPVVSAGLAIRGKDYVAYLADQREVTESSAGSPVSGTISIQLPEGDYRIRFFSPVSGEYSQPQAAKGGGTVKLALTTFQHDLVLRAVRAS